MEEVMYPPATQEVYERRKELAPEINEAFENFSHKVFAEGAHQDGPAQRGYS